jgi:hypothetical protein
LVTNDGPSTAGGDFSVNPLAPIVTRLANLVSAQGIIFKSVTGFFLSEWDLLWQLVVPALTLFARSTGSPVPCKNICLQIRATWVLKSTSCDESTTGKYRTRKETLSSEHLTKGTQLVEWKLNGESAGRKTYFDVL